MVLPCSGQINNSRILGLLDWGGIFTMRLSLKVYRVLVYSNCVLLLVILEIRILMIIFLPESIAITRII